MGILRNKTYKDNSHLGIWRLEESVEELKAQLELTEVDIQLFGVLKTEQRQREWLAARVLIQELAGQLEQVVYDEFRKPHLASENFHLSISHSGGQVAVVLHPTHPTGIDIQQKTDKVWRIRHKFLSPTELEACADGEDLNRLLIYWSAKEAMYKYYGRKRLLFAEHMWVGAFDFSENGGEFKGGIRLPQETHALNLSYEISGDCFLVFVVNN